MNCDRCGKQLEPLRAGCEHACTLHHSIGAGQYDNALEIHLRGGYGMFVDPLEGGDPYRRHAGRRHYSFLVCHDCAHELVEREPWLKNGIGEPVLTHSHRPGTVSARHLTEQERAWRAVHPAEEVTDQATSPFDGMGVL